MISHTPPITRKDVLRKNSSLNLFNNEFLIHYEKREIKYRRAASLGGLIESHHGGTLLIDLKISAGTNMIGQANRLFFFHSYSLNTASLVGSSLRRKATKYASFDS